ncbi:MAG TPA: hypothetical protein VG538_13770 [Vicinamibacterales bacterium]|nr:hypothetical protein [Vicinamibacterales bacterium]
MRDERMDADDPLRALADALDVEPSPGFGAQARQRIDADRGARRRTRRYAMAIIVPAAAIALVVVWAAHRPSDVQPRAVSSHAEVVPQSAPPHPVAPTTEDLAAERSATAVVARTRESRMRDEGRRGSPRAFRNESQAFAAVPVVVPRGQLEGVRQLASAAASGRVRIGPPLADWAAGVQPEATPLQAPDPLRVPALSVEPLAN